ncbi:MAG: hypothetical protein ACRCSB_02485 [Bacteroidales bacterium]
MSFFCTKRPIFTLCILACFWQCSQEYICPVPNIKAFSFDITMPNYNTMDAKIKNGIGYNGHGILVYHHYDGAVYAYDATCANDSECVKNGVIRFDGQGHPTATCRRCRSQYYLLDGKHLKEKLLLRQYGVQKILYTSDQYRIFN